MVGQPSPATVKLPSRATGNDVYHGKNDRDCEGITFRPSLLNISDWF